MNTLIRYACLMGVLLLLLAAPLHAKKEFTDSQEADFVDSGLIEIELTAGEHTISASDDNSIRVSWRVDKEDTQKVDTQTRVDGSTAKIDIDGPRKNFRTYIEVPRNSDLVVRLTAGELDIEHIRGNKDIKLRAGELSIQVGDPAEYSKVKGSLWAGNIDAGPFNDEKSGLFRSIEWKGGGDQTLKFKLYAGDVRLIPTRSSLKGADHTD